MNVHYCRSARLSRGHSYFYWDLFVGFLFDEMYYFGSTSGFCLWASCVTGCNGPEVLVGTQPYVEGMKSW